MATSRRAKARAASRSKRNMRQRQNPNTGDTHSSDIGNPKSDPTASGKHFPFLKLPAELRNNIYEKVFDDLPQVYLTTRSSNLASRSALPRVSRQIRQEFLPAMYLCAGEVIATVTNFQFGHVITFLNSLSDTEMHALIEAPRSRNVKIELRFTRNVYDDLSTLDRWINRMEHPTKRGTKINASYVVTASATGVHLGYRNTPSPPHNLGQKKLDEYKKVHHAVNTWINSAHRGSMYFITA